MMHSSFSRRSLLLSGAALGLGLAGCSNPYLGGRVADDAAELQVLMANWGQLYNDAMRAIGKAYAAEHEGAAVRWDFNQEWKTKLLTQMNGNTPPDVTYTNWVELPELAASDKLQPIDDRLQQAQLDRSSFVGPVYDACLKDGKLVALPGGADFLALYWSKDLYRDVGLDPEQPPTTADELVTHSLEILQTDTSGAITRMGYMPTAADFVQWALIFGGSFYDAESDKVTADHEANVEALDWILQYVKKIDINQLAAFGELPDYSQPGNPFAAKKSAYVYTGFWAYDALDQYAPDLDYGVTFFPTRTGADEERSAYLVQGWQWAIPSNAKHPDAAWELMKFALIDRAAQMGYETLNGPCYLDQFGDFQDGLADKIGPSNRLTPYLDVFTRTGEAGQQHWPNIAASSYYYDQVTRAYDLVTRGKAAPRKALAEVQRNVEARLKEQR